MLVMATAWLGLTLGAAGVEVADPPPKELLARVAELREGYEAKAAAFWKQFEKIDGDEARRRYHEVNFPRANSVADQLLELTAPYPGQRVEFDIALWAIDNSVRGSSFEAALGRLESHVDRPEIKRVLRDLAGEICPAAGRLLLAAKRSSDPELRGLSAYWYAKHLSRRIDTIGRYATGDASLRRRYENWYGVENLSELATLDLERLQVEAETAFSVVAKEHGELKHFRGDLEAACKADLFELRYLGYGSVAPEIEGEDIAGERFKLSDYRGKVVVLDFWGHW